MTLVLLNPSKLSTLRWRQKSLDDDVLILNKVLAVIRFILIKRRRIQPFSRELNKAMSEVLVRNKIIFVYVI